MENFWVDIKSNVLGYYDGLVELFPRLLVCIMVITVGWIIYRIVKRYLAAKLNVVLDDPLIAKFIVRVVKVALMIIVLLICLKIIGLEKIATGLWGTAGVGAFILGFAFKDIGENFLAGFMLAFSRPFRNGDIIEVNGIKGKVIGLTMRNTHLKTFSGKDVYIPNSQLIKNVLINDTIDGFIRQEYSLEVHQNTNIDEMEKTLLETLKGIHGILQEEKVPSVWVNGIVDGKISLTIRYWLDTFDSSIDSSLVRRTAIGLTINALKEMGIQLQGQVVELNKSS